MAGRGASGSGWGYIPAKGSAQERRGRYQSNADNPPKETPQPRTAQVETVSMMGRTIRVIRMSDGSALSEQKKSMELLQWRDQIVAGMTKAGFNRDEIVDVLKQERNVGYFNKKFYRRPKDITQRAIEGWYK